MRQLAEQAFPFEACGLIAAKGRKTHLISCENISDDPRNNFQISHLKWNEVVEELGMEVVGVWHSHVNEPAMPSVADKMGCELTALPWFITAIYQNEVGVFTHTAPELLTPEGFTLDYEGRPYVFGVMDCYSIVREYLKREHDIALDFKGECRIPDWVKKGHNFFVDNYAEQGFERLSSGVEPKPGDLFLIQVTSRHPDHIAVYVGDDMILHHQHGRLSCKTVYGGFWHARTTHHLRHTSKC